MWVGHRLNTDDMSPDERDKYIRANNWALLFIILVCLVLCGAMSVYTFFSPVQEGEVAPQQNIETQTENQ